jgi:ribosomal protein S18 acetylase RimI-like enzyme
MIEYINNLDNVNEEQLEGFFVDWPNPPSKSKHLELLRNSSYIWLALDNKNEKVIGFINAITDQVLSAYIPLLEVLPEHQGKGIGKKLAELMIETLKTYYMVDIICDPNMQPFYEQFGMHKASGVSIRNHEKQDGLKN